MKKTLPRLGAPFLTILFSILLLTCVSSLADPGLGDRAFRLYRAAMLLTAFMALRSGELFADGKFQAPAVNLLCGLMFAAIGAAALVKKVTDREEEA